MKKVNLSIISITLGIILISLVLIFNIEDTLGFLTFLIGFLLTFIGVILNKKIREIVINFVINFL
ncbi:MAG: hypothetical protein GX275_08760 [Clostridiales bacterium]|nr:hypothetical protein [Clostridiales bacterium]